MSSYMDSIQADMEKVVGRPVSRTTARLFVVGACAVVVGLYAWSKHPAAEPKMLKVTAAEWGAKWPYPGFSEGLLWCKSYRGSPATFIRLGGNDFGTNGTAYDMPGVLSDKGLLKRAAFPYYGIDSDAGDGAQEQLDIAKGLCS